MRNLLIPIFLLLGIETAYAIEKRCPHNTSCTINFHLHEVDGVDLRVDATCATGDILKSDDEGAEASTGDCFTDEGSFYSYSYTCNAARCTLLFIDQTATKVWLDQVVHIETYGTAAGAQHDTGADVEKWSGTAVATPSTAGVPEVDVTHINGGLTSGNNATLSLAAINVTNSGGDAVTFSSTGSNGEGLYVTGNGTGAGAQFIGGATGIGVNIDGGGTSGAALEAASTSGNAVTFTAGGGNGTGLDVVGNGAGSAFRLTGGATGNGLLANGGATSGDAAKFAVTSGDLFDLGGTDLDAVINAQVVDVMQTDTHTELTSCPTATASYDTILRYLLMWARNKITEGSGTGTLFRDDGSTALCTHTNSDNGTTFTRGEGS